MWDTARELAARAGRRSSCCGPPAPDSARRPCRRYPACASDTSASSPRARTQQAFAGVAAEGLATWPPCSTPAAPPGRRSWPRTRTPTRSPTRGCWPRTRCSTPTPRSSPRCRCSTSTRWSSRCWRRCSRASRWCGPGRSATATPRCSAQFWQIVEHYRIAAMSAVPTVYAALAQVPVDADIGSLRVAMVGASPLPAAVRDAFQAHTGVRLLEGYGLTEATCASARSFPDAPRPGSVGQRLPYQRVRSRPHRADGSWDGPAHRRAVGVLAISGPTVFPGYVIGRDEDGHVLDGLGKLVDGWLDTGDLARGRRGRLRPPDRPGQGPDHPRRPQHRPRDHRGRAARPPAGHRGRRRRPARRPRRGGTGRLRHPRPRRRPSPRTSCATGRPTGSPNAPPHPRPSPCSTRCRSPPSASRTSWRCAPTPPDAPSPTPSPGSPAPQVDTAIDDGSVVTTVTVADDTDTAAVTAVLDQYALRWHLNVPATDSAPVSD